MPARPRNVGHRSCGECHLDILLASLRLASKIIWTIRITKVHYMCHLPHRNGNGCPRKHRCEESGVAFRISVVGIVEGLLRP